MLIVRAVRSITALLLLFLFWGEGGGGSLARTRTSRICSFWRARTMRACRFTMIQARRAFSVLSDTATISVVRHVLSLAQWAARSSAQRWFGHLPTFTSDSEPNITRTRLSHRGCIANPGLLAAVTHLELPSRGRSKRRLRGRNGFIRIVLVHGRADSSEERRGARRTTISSSSRMRRCPIDRFGLVRVGSATRHVEGGRTSSERR